jgi:hypothetical protein
VLQLDPWPPPRVEDGRQATNADAGVAAEARLPHDRDLAVRVPLGDVVAHLLD